MKKSSGPELLAQLSAPIPEQYLRELSNGLTDIDFSYQLMRVNQVFGLAGWSRKSRIVSAEKIGLNGKSEKTQWEVSAEVVIKIPVLKRTINNFGAWSSDVKSDALMGAVTRATSKCFQELGIGHEIYSRRPEPKVYGKSAVSIFRQGFILGFDAAKEELDRAGALQDFTLEFEEEMKLAMTKPEGERK